MATPIANINALNTQVGKVSNTEPARGGLQKNQIGGPSFREKLEQLQKQALNDARPAQTAPSQLTFSKHAIERLQRRNISMGPERVAKLNQALAKAEAKGSKDTLVLTGDAAFIMNVKNKMVVTAMDQSMMKENVFTNIDSTVIV